MNETCTQAWQALVRRAQTLEGTHLRELFAGAPGRFERFSYEAADLFVDFSKQRLDEETLARLLDLARAREVPARIEALFAGERVNNTEDRAAMHPALRARPGEVYPSADDDVVPGVRAVLDSMYEFAGRVRSGTWVGHSGRRIETVVNIGIGGSDLGPAMVAHALEPFRQRGLDGHFVSNIDGAALGRVIDRLDPETTLFVIASKTFSTEETLTNARSAREWVVGHYGTGSAVARHFVAVSTQTDRVREFGIDPANMFGFWDWVGGRYSVWSAIGLSLVTLLGEEVFEAFLGGARALDDHFRHTPLERNVPVLLALTGVWNRNFLGASTHAVLPYDYGLRLFPDYLQQLEMESNGKHVSRDGERLEHDTCPIVWGGLGNNGQHAFYQLLHQGTSLVSADFLIAAHSQHAAPDHQSAVLANALAQSRALMQGRDLDQALAETRSEGRPAGSETLIARHRVLRGNQPSTTLLFERLTPATLGQLIALYEHKVYVQSVLWDINAFDQWGVELGKALARGIETTLEEGTDVAAQDESTAGLIERLRAMRRSG